MKLDKSNPSIVRYLNEGFVPGFLIRENNRHGVKTIDVVTTLVREDGETRSVSDIPEDSLGIRVFNSSLENLDWHIPILSGGYSELELTEPAGLLTINKLAKKVATGQKIQKKIDKMIGIEGAPASVGKSINLLGRAIGITHAYLTLGKIKGKFVHIGTLASNIDYALDERKEGL